MIVPAHNEASGIGRLLSALTVPETEPAVEVLVVCNGCTDTTAEIARHWAPGVRVIEIPEASKSAALAAGNSEARYGIRVYCDADVVLDRAGLTRLTASLGPGVLAVGPRRRLDLTGASWPVRAYYRFWERLPQVRSDLFGRGVVALSPEGVVRVASLPSVMSDDLAISEAFAAGERRVVEDVESVVIGARSLGDLIRRRTRVAIGNSELDRLGLRGPAARTGVRTIALLVRQRPTTGIDAGVFLLIAALARGYAFTRRLRGISRVWLRDESSRRDG